MKKNVLAVDFGASSGRVILGAFTDGQLRLEEIHRFSNEPLAKGSHLYWDFTTLCQEMLVGIQKALANYEIDSIGIDTWGVDYGLLDGKGQLLGLPIHYRDLRTVGYVERGLEQISPEELYRQTGNQLMEINTLFQLLAEKEQGTLLTVAKTLLFMPGLFGHFLTGNMQTEVSIASTSQLMNPITSEWNWPLIEQFDLPTTIFPPIVQPGTLLGKLRRSNLPEIPVLNVGSHDTASAVASVPAEHRFLFISCGTWSLVGTELPKPVLTTKAQTYNLTNEKGVNQTTRFLKNITGLWVIQEVKREFEASGKYYTYEELESLAAQEGSLRTLIDTDAPEFIGSGQMIKRIKAFALETGQPIPETDGQVIRCIYESLAFKYKYTFLEIVDAVGYEFDSVNIVGGGSQSRMLCEMVASATNLTVFAGPDEATAIGNINTQLMYHGAIASLEEARGELRTSEYVKKYLPKRDRLWDYEFGRYQQLLVKT